MHIGATYPQIEPRGDPRAFDAFARATEARGYDSLAMFDHVAGAVHEGREPPLCSRAARLRKDCSRWLRDMKMR